MKVSRGFSARREKLLRREDNPKEGLIDYVVERVAGREMSYPQRYARMHPASERLVQEPVTAQRHARRAG